MAPPTSQDHEAVLARRFHSVSIGALVVFSVAVLLASLGVLLSSEYGRDQGIYALVAREMLDGRMPYRDVFDFKPPGIFFLYEVSRLVFGGAHWGIRLIEAVAMLAMVGGLMAITRHVMRSLLPGLVAGAFGVFLHVSQGAWHTGQPEGFGGVLTIWALYAALRGWDSRGRTAWMCWFASGVLFGGSTLLKPQLAGAGVLIAFIAALGLQPGGELRSLRDRVTSALGILTAMAVGIGLPVAITVAWFAARGALRELYEVLFVFTPKYTLLSWSTGSFSQKMSQAVDIWSLGFSPVIGLGAIFLLTASLLGDRTRRRRNVLAVGIAAGCYSLDPSLGFGATLLLTALLPNGRDQRLVVVLFATLAVQMLGVVLQAKFFLYHWGATHPISALIAVLAVVKLFERLHAVSLPLAVSVTAGIIAAHALGLSRDTKALFRSTLAFRVGAVERVDDFTLRPGDFNPNADQILIEELTRTTPAGSPIFIWGFEPAIYDDLNRPIASRYIYNVPQRSQWSAAESRKVLMSDLRASRPSAIVVEHGDVFPWVVGDRFDSADKVGKFVEFKAMLAGEYSQYSSGDRYDVFLRNDLHPTPDPSH